MDWRWNEPGVWVSGVAHVTILGLSLLTLNSLTFPPAEEGIPVEVITDSQFSEITRGEKTAQEVKPDPRPRVDRLAETEVQRDPGEAARDVPTPPTRPAEMKVDENEVAAAPPPPARPEPAPEPPKRDVAKPPEPSREEQIRLAEREAAEALARQEAARAKAEAEAKAKAEADAKAKAVADAKAKAEAEAKAKAVAEAKAKAAAEAKAKAEAEAKAKRQAELAASFNPGKINDLLRSKETAQSSGATGREVNRTAALGTATGTSQRLNPSMRHQLMGIIQDQLYRCWQAPIGAQTVDKPPVPQVDIRLKQDGSLAAEPAVTNPSSDPLFRIVADSATRATRRCAPLRIPAQFAPYYDDWKELKVNFNPRDTG